MYNIDTPRTLSNGLQRLATQLRNLDVPFTKDFDGAMKETNHIVDAIFGISLSRACSAATEHLQVSVSRATFVSHLQLSFRPWKRP